MVEKLKKEYDVKCFRLHPETIKQITQLKEATGVSYNKLFVIMIEEMNGKKQKHHHNKRS
jgi:hypothetical protein